MSVYLDGFPDATGVPVLDAGDELGLVPEDGVVFGVGVFDNRGLVEFSFPAMGSVFLESGREVPSSLADVHLAALARDLVDTWSAVGVLAVFVRGQQVLYLQGGCVKHPNAVLVKDTLDVVGGSTEVGESDGTRGTSRLALGIGDPLAGGRSGVLCGDTGRVVAIALHCCGDVVEFLGQVLTVADIVGPPDEGTVD